MKGGYRPTAGRLPGRPLGAKNKTKVAWVETLDANGQVPTEPMQRLLLRMRDPLVDPLHRDRIALTLIPYFAVRVSDSQSIGKRARAAAAETWSARGTSWEGLVADGPMEMPEDEVGERPLRP